MKAKSTKLLPTFYLAMVAILLPAGAYAADSDSAPTNVTVSRFDALAYFPESSAPASVVSLNDAVLSAQIQSSVIAIPVKVGDVVNRGDVLVALDCRNAESMLKANQARVDLANYQLQRAKKLHKKDHVSEEVLRQRQSEMASALSAQEISEVDVERCNITAPFSGVVQERLIDIGEWVNTTPGTKLVRIVDLDEIEVTAEVSAFNNAGLADAGGYDFLLGDKRYPLARRAISAVTDADGRTRTIRLTFIADKAAPGESGRLIWRDSKRYLPSDYLEKRDGIYGVVIADGDEARFVPVPAAQEGRPIYIELSDETKIIVKGRQSVSNGDAITIVP